MRYHRGFVLPPRLKLNERWVPRKLQDLIASGILGVWQECEEMAAKRRNGKIDAADIEAKEEPKAISLVNAWLADVFNV